MLYNVIALALLGFGFAVLVVTFLWVARLLSMRAQQRAAREGVAPGVDWSPEAAEGEGITIPEEATPALDEAEIRRAAGRAVILGANLSLVLGVLACLLFWLSPLFGVLSLAGLYYGARCQWLAWRHFRLLVVRALIGFSLSAASLGLHYLKMTDQISAVLPLLATV